MLRLVVCKYISTCFHVVRMPLVVCSTTKYQLICFQSTYTIVDIPAIFSSGYSSIRPDQLHFVDELGVTGVCNTDQNIILLTVFICVYIDQTPFCIAIIHLSVGYSLFITKLMDEPHRSAKQ